MHTTKISSDISDKIHNINELINDIYDIVCTNTGDFIKKNIDVSTINLNRFKLSDYDLDTIFGGDQIYYVNTIKTGITDRNQIILKKVFTHEVNIRLVPYLNKASVANIKDPVNVNLIIRTLLSEIVINDKTTNILLPIINIDVLGSDIINYKLLSPLIDSDKYYSIQLTEKCYSLVTLDFFLRKYPLNYDIIKNIIFQIVDVLYQINNKFDGFQYNQLFPDMIDCYLKKVNDVIYPKIKLSQFYLSEIKNIVPNEYLKTINMVSITNSPYDDLYQFLNYLYNNINLEIKKHPQLESIFDLFLPKKIRSESLYLSKKLWNSLSDDEKSDLKIKNIRFNQIFTNKDFIADSNFMNTDVDELADYLTNKKTNSSRINHDATNNNKKYNTNDIDHMKKNDIKDENKIKSSKKNRHNSRISYISADSDKFSESDNFSESNNMETTENVNRSHHRPTKIINMSDRPLENASNHKLKSFKGSRYIYDPKIYQNNTNNDQQEPPNNDQSRINTIGKFLGAPPNLSHQPNINYNQIAQQLSQSQQIAQPQQIAQSQQLAQPQYVQPQNNHSVYQNPISPYNNFNQQIPLPQPVQYVQHPNMNIPANQYYTSMPPNQINQVPGAITNPINTNQDYNHNDQNMINRYMAASGYNQNDPNIIGNQQQVGGYKEPFFFH